MSRKKKPKQKPRPPFYQEPPLDTPKLTPTADKLLRRIWKFNIRGCWMSNKTMAAELRCCIRSIRNARNQLIRYELAIIARTTPCTWSMWCRYHPWVQRTRVLWFRGGQMDNLYYQGPEALHIGGKICPSGGQNLPPTCEYKNLPTGDILTGGFQKGSRPPVSTKRISEAAASEPLQQAATPQDLTIRRAVKGCAPLRPAVHGEQSSKSGPQTKFVKEMAERKKAKELNEFMKNQSQQKKHQAKKQGNRNAV